MKKLNFILILLVSLSVVDAFSAPEEIETALNSFTKCIWGSGLNPSVKYKPKIYKLPTCNGKPSLNARKGDLCEGDILCMPEKDPSAYAHTAVEFHVRCFSNPEGTLCPDPLTCRNDIGLEAYDEFEKNSSDPRFMKVFNKGVSGDNAK